MPVCLYLCLINMVARGGHQIPRTRIVDMYELPCECWVPSLDLLQEQKMFLSAKSSFQSQFRTSAMFVFHGDFLSMNTIKMGSGEEWKI